MSNFFPVVIWAGDKDGNVHYFQLHNDNNMTEMMFPGYATLITNMEELQVWYGVFQQEYRAIVAAQKEAKEQLDVAEKEHAKNSPTFDGMQEKVAARFDSVLEARHT